MPHLSAELIPAMVTPFKRDGSLDLDRAAAMAKYLVDQQDCDGLLINGTTGESPCLGFEEKISLLQTVKEAVAGRKVQIVAGIGSNDTAKSVQEAEKVAALGVADALLLVVPYYNKPSQRGMLTHFERVAQAVSETEVVIYNIPSRSVVLMAPETMEILHGRCPNVIGVKQSCPDMDQVSEISLRLPKENWRTWCGDDSLTVPMMACGAYGTFSVLAHLTGKLMREMIQAVKRNEREKALALHLQQLNLARDIFFLPNPTVIKTCMAELGLLEPIMREPMLWPDEVEMLRIRQILAEAKGLSPSRVS
jgi:4-hydroxy-tetrahydrodipicolinate synthase